MLLRFQATKLLCSNHLFVNGLGISDRCKLLVLVVFWFGNYLKDSGYEAELSCYPMFSYPLLPPFGIGMELGFNVPFI